MRKIARFIISHRKLVLLIFVFASIICGVFATQVRINYNLADYVPDSAPSTQAVRAMEREFSSSIPNAQVCVPDISLTEALEIKSRLAKIANVTEVLWLDDVVDLTKPLEILDPKLIEPYYKDQAALYQVTVGGDDNPAALAALQEVAGPDGGVSGQLVDLAKSQMSVQSEMAMIIAFAIPLGLIILLLATHSWLEPFLFLVTIGVAVLLNMGTNLIFGEISFITQSVGAVLQLAVSMDYAIFMLHRFNQYRQAGHDIEQAMELAIAKVFSSVTASAATTVFGFLALIFMRFKIGPDMGLVMAKGIVFSLISVIFFLPVLLLIACRLVDKTLHRPFLPSFAKFGRGVVKGRVAILLVFLLIVSPVFLAQRHNSFLYGAGSYPKASREARDRERITEQFGQNMQMAILVPRDEVARQKLLVNRLENISQVKSVISLVGLVGTGVPTEVMPQSQVESLVSDSYSRIIVIADSKAEGDAAFALADEIRETLAQVFPEEAHLAGENISMLDMRDTVAKDNNVVNGLAILAVGLVLLLTFRSLTLPLILLLTIETSIWINLSIPYFSNVPLNFIGYLVISTVQLGATIDYAILYTQHYLDCRKTLLPRQAGAQALAETMPSLLPPALILTLVGMVLGFVSTIDVVSELGMTLGRGAVLSLILVATVLPSLLILLDRLVGKTTWRANFHRAKAGDVALEMGTAASGMGPQAELQLHQDLSTTENSRTAAVVPSSGDAPAQTGEIQHETNSEN